MSYQLLPNEQKTIAFGNDFGEDIKAPNSGD